ncbi:MAG: formate--tetrahydrofolate ligase [Alphaproteobacteria bacterium]|nr:formate--tetrahydrofolate ligase [Alphaproteobacteria bacterium]
MPTDLEIARSVTPKKIAEVAHAVAIADHALIPYGHIKAKIDLAWCQSRIAANPRGKLILVTATNPTPAGEGKTTTTIGLADALNRGGHKTVIALREPSLGPCFGRKGGATGGGRAQIIPMEDINLHFNGDFHAITAAHNLLAAMLDNHLHFGNALDIDPSTITWGRVLDVCDRALRNIEVGTKPETRHASRFDITVASEIMAIFCLAESLEDLAARLSRIVVAYTRSGKPVTPVDLKAVGSMVALLRDALAPNLVQSLEGTPAIVHGGPFANIAHGCNTVIATRTALALGDYAVTEAGFGADLGAEKFLDIKCRQTGLWPDAAVIVATVRALKMHGGMAKADLSHENVEALKKGFANLQRHIRNMKSFGLPVVVGINHFVSDTDVEWQTLKALVEAEGVPVALCRHWAEGGKGCEELATIVTKICATSAPKYLYGDDYHPADKIAAVATKLYGASDVTLGDGVRAKLDQYIKEGYGRLPVCMAKTQESFATDPKLLGAPEGHTLHVRDVRLSAGAGFIVALCGTINTMPGLPRVPAAEAIGLDADGNIVGLF